MLSALHKGDKAATRHNEYEKQNNEKVAKMSKKKKNVQNTTTNSKPIVFPRIF